MTDSFAPALRVTDVRKTYGTITAVDGLSLSAERASVLALLGPNGAGKTTTIEMCEGFTTPTAGTIEVLGLNPVTHPDQVRRKIGIMLQGGGAYPGIRVREMLQLVARYSKNPLDPDWLLETVGLDKHLKSSYRRLSGGQQQRLSLACALVGRPEMVFLDEPTAGMDAQSRLAVWELISALKRDGVTVLLTTHLMDEAEALADKVVIIDHGRKVAEGTPAELTSAASNPTTAQMKIETATALDLDRFAKDLDAVSHLTGSDAVTITTTKPLSYRLSAHPNPAFVAAAARAAANQDVLIRSFSIDHRSLEDVFLDITGTAMRS